MQDQINLKAFLRIGEAAKLLGVSMDTLRNWDRSGKLRSVRNPVNGYRLYSRHQLSAFLRQLESPVRHSERKRYGS